MPTSSRRSLMLYLQHVSGVAGWVLVAGLLVAAVLWASEPGAADPPATTWKPGRTVTTWDWEQHWNYWKKSTCTRIGVRNNQGIPYCMEWLDRGNVWKSCGSRISPPDPSRVNSCNIGSAGGHKPHGDGVKEKYSYLGRHEDRDGPSYAVCKGDSSLPADTSPGNCGTWVTIPHTHCEDDPDAHPPDCGETTQPSEPETTATTAGPSTSGPSTTVPRTTTTRPRTTTTRKPTTTTPPTSVPAACEHSDASDAFRDAVDDLPRPGVGLQPPANGYVRVPIRVHYAGSPRTTLSVVIDGDRAEFRIWLGTVSWLITDIATSSGTEIGAGTLHLYGWSYDRAPSLADPIGVSAGSEPVFYPRSSLRQGHSEGHPITLFEVWTGQCRESGASGWTDLGEHRRQFEYRYMVYEVRSRASG